MIENPAVVLRQASGGFTVRRNRFTTVESVVGQQQSSDPQSRRHEVEQSQGILSPGKSTQDVHEYHVIAAPILFEELKRVLIDDRHRVAEATIFRLRRAVSARSGDISNAVTHPSLGFTARPSQVAE